MGREEGRGKRKAKQVLEDEEEDEEPIQEVELDEEEEDPRGKAKAAKRGKEPARQSGGEGGSQRQRSTGGPSRGEGSGAGRGGDDGGVADCADVKPSELIASAKDRLEEAEGKMKNKPDQKDVIKIVRDVMRYMLFTVPKTKDAPVPKSELTSLVTKISKERGLPDVVICTAQLKFLENFGMEMAELTKRKKAVPAKKALKAKTRQKYVDLPSALPARGLTMVVVGLLSIAGGSMAEEDLHHHLQSLGARKADKNHFALGNVANALDALCKQRFIMQETDPADDKRKLYCLAEAAQDQLGADLINKFIACYAQPGAGGRGGDDDDA